MKSFAAAMQRFATEAGVEPTPAPLSRDYLRRLPPTQKLQTQRAALDTHLQLLGEQTIPARLRAQQRDLVRDLAAAEERDRLQAGRPAGCTCLGLGGWGERVAWMGDGDLPVVLDTYCICPEAEARRAADELVRQRGRQHARQMELQAIWHEAGIPARFEGLSFETYPVSPQTAAAVETVKTWADSAFWGLLLRGTFGVGKTGLAVSTMRAGMTLGDAGLFVKAPDILARVRATYGKNADGTEQDVLASLDHVPWLILDDLGADEKGPSDWARGMLWRVLEGRHDAKKKTIVTTNLDLKQLESHLGTRTMERFKEELLIVHLQGPNLRDRR